MGEHPAVLQITFLRFLQAGCSSLENKMFGEVKQTFDPYSEPEVSTRHISKYRSDNEKYTFNILGKEIIVFPEVFSPKHAITKSVEFFIENMVSPENKRVLDVGTGTGVLGLVSAFKGASLVHSIDINPNAVANARANFEKYNFGEDRCVAYHSDLFEAVKLKFDIALFNPPHQAFKPKDMLERAYGDENYAVLKRFLSEVGGYLSSDGTVCLCFSELGDLELLERLIKNSGLVVEKTVEDLRPMKTYLIIMKKPNLD